MAQPRQSFDGADLYPSIPEKAAALGFSLISNHPFIDGNKRVGHAAIEIFLILNGHELHADVDEQERLVLGVAAERSVANDSPNGSRITRRLGRKRNRVANACASCCAAPEDHSRESGVCGVALCWILAGYTRPEIRSNCLILLYGEVAKRLTAPVLKDVRPLGEISPRF